MSRQSHLLAPKPGRLSLRDLEMSLATRLSSFAILGIDLKITPKDDCKIIEVNGIHSGMKGFGLAGVVPVMHAPDDSYLLPPPSSEFNACERSVQYYLALNLGTKVAHFIVKHLEEMDFQPSYLARYIDDLTRENALDQASRPLAEMLFGIEQILQDKLQTDAHFQNAREWKPKTYATIQELLKAETATYIVRKPQKGMRGVGVEILGTDNLDELTEKPETVVESFVYSKPILHDAQGTYHDGCMRYIIVVEDCITSGKIELTHFGGYWRLCPLPIEQYGHIDSMRANLAQGAIAQRASSEDLEIVQKSVDAFVPLFYRSLVHEVKERILQQTI